MFFILKQKRLCNLKRGGLSQDHEICLQTHAFLKNRITLFLFLKHNFLLFLRSFIFIKQR